MVPTGLHKRSREKGSGIFLSLFEAAHAKVVAGMGHVGSALAILDDVFCCERAHGGSVGTTRNCVTCAAVFCSASIDLTSRTPGPRSPARPRSSAASGPVYWSCRLAVARATLSSRTQHNIIDTAPRGGARVRTRARSFQPDTRIPRDRTGANATRCTQTMVSEAGAHFRSWPILLQKYFGLPSTQH